MSKFINPKILTLLVLFFTLFFVACNTRSFSISENQKNLNNYNVIWDSPSKDYNGSMPIGNGDIGLNVWVEENGDICFFIGKTDSWGENGRLLKVGKVRVKCEPEIISPGTTFKQELDLETGTIQISSIGKLNDKKEEINFQLWVDANHPVINIAHESTIPLKMIASVELWRTDTFRLNNAVFSDLMQSHTSSSEMRQPVFVNPDVIVDDSDGEIIWYHHNNESNGFNYVNELQGISEFCTSDPLMNRTFGAFLTGTNSKRTNKNTIETDSKKNGTLTVCVLTQHPSDPENWKLEIEKLANEIESLSYNKRQNEHEQWWSDFWNRSWIHAVSDSIVNDKVDNAFIVSRAYALQRFIDACAGRGAHPIKFNGSIFTVPPGESIPWGDADYRRWGPGYWWQNTRLPYLSMCAAGDFDLIQPLFDTYGKDIFEICKKRTRKNFGFDGAYFPECMYFWGAQFPIDYGPKPWSEREDKLQDSRYHKWEWVSGPELVFMMLDYYDYTQDTVFLKKDVIPLANEVIQFFDNYYSTNDEGKWVMHPSQALETWWKCTNPMPELAGLYGIIRRLKKIPEQLTEVKDRKFWEEMYDKLPDIPRRETDSGTALAPAEVFENKRNVENPELYAVFPFRLFGIGNSNPEWGKNALEHRWDKGSFGWRQDELFMAYLGLTDEASEFLVNRAKTYDENSRFPAFWGPNYDWVPDQDHGGVLMKTLQSMLMQADPYSEKIYLLPAWPKEWNVSFKLHAPKQTIVEGKIQNGEIKILNVTPESREADIIVWNDQEQKN